MKKYIASFMILISSAAVAGNTSDAVRSAGFNQLSEAQKAEVIKMVAEKASKNEAGPGASAEERVEKWVKIGSNIGQGLAGAARELGVAVNEFSQTPVGRLTMALIVWNMIGSQLIHIFGGILIWVVGIYIIRSLIARSYPSKITYSKTVKNWRGQYVIESVEPTRMDSDTAGGWALVYGAVLVAGLVAIFTY